MTSQKQTNPSLTIEIMLYKKKNNKHVNNFMTFVLIFSILLYHWSVLIIMKNRTETETKGNNFPYFHTNNPIFHLIHFLKMGQVRDFFISDFSTFWLSLNLESELKKFRISPIIWCQTG